MQIKIKLGIAATDLQTKTEIALADTRVCEEQAAKLQAEIRRAEDRLAALSGESKMKGSLLEAQNMQVGMLQDELLKLREKRKGLEARVEESSKGFSERFKACAELGKEIEQEKQVAGRLEEKVEQNKKSRAKREKELYRLQKEIEEELLAQQRLEQSIREREEEVSRADKQLSRLNRQKIERSRSQELKCARLK